MERNGLFLATLWALILQLGICDVEMPYHLQQRLEDEVHLDDNQQVLQKVRTRIVQGLNKTYGVVMVATSNDLSYSAHTIPVWKAYCEKMGYDFFLQEESMAPSVRDHWTKPRLMMELATKAKWKYIWLVDSNSIPVNFEKGFQYAIKEHLRKQRYNNDNQKERMVWCPEDCDEGAGDNALSEGTCYGPLVSGCIFWNKPKKLLPILATWYKFRAKLESEGERGLKMALSKTRESSNYDAMFWSDVSDQIGRPNSNFMVTHTYDEQLKFNLRDQVVRTITKYKLLGNILNDVGEHRPEMIVEAEADRAKRQEEQRIQQRAELKELEKGSRAAEL